MRMIRIDEIILRALRNSRLCGAEILRRVQLPGDNTATISSGSLYPSLRRLTNKGLIGAEVQERAGRTSVYYTLTDDGAAQEQLNTAAIMHVLGVEFWSLTEDGRVGRIPSGGDAERCVHNIKTKPPFYHEVLKGKKTFEYRLNDRGYRVGDLLHLELWTEEGGYGGPSFVVVVTYMMSVPGQKDMVIMSIRRLEP